MENVILTILSFKYAYDDDVLERFQAPRGDIGADCLHFTGNRVGEFLIEIQARNLSA